MCILILSTLANGVEGFILFDDIPIYLELTLRTHIRDKISSQSWNRNLLIHIANKAD